MSNPLISIIVPIHNVERHLSECLDSVMAQSYPHWECICINDGSTDSSPALLESYASRDPRIIAVHTENAGVSAARNKGLNLMRGAYFTFLDGDDRYAADALAQYLDLAQRHDADIVEASTALFSTDGQRHWSVWEEEWSAHHDRVYAQGETPSFLTIKPYVWNALYSRSLWERACIYFAPHLRISEDYHFKLSLLAHVSAPYVFTSKLLYNYRKGRLDSAMSKTDSVQMVRHERRSIESVFRLWQREGRLSEVQIDLMDMIYYSWRNRYEGMSHCMALLESIPSSSLLAQVLLANPHRESWKQFKLRQRELLRLTRNHIRRPARARAPQKAPQYALGFSKAHFALSLYDPRLIALPLAPYQQEVSRESLSPSDARFRFPLRLKPAQQISLPRVPAALLTTSSARRLI